MLKEKLMAVRFTKKQAETIEFLVFDWSLSLIGLTSPNYGARAEFVTSQFVLAITTKDMEMMAKVGLNFCTFQSRDETHQTVSFWAYI